MERKVILIDDNWERGWADVFKYIFSSIYGELITLEVLQQFDTITVSECYKQNPDALFIQDNNLGAGNHDGLYWLWMWGDKRAIIMHSADDVGFEAGQMNALLYIRKDNPEHPMSHQQMYKQVADLHKSIIKHFKLVPELMWIVYNQIGWPEEETPQ